MSLSVLLLYFNLMCASGMVLKTPQVCFLHHPTVDLFDLNILDYRLHGKDLKKLKAMNLYIRAYYKLFIRMI